MYSNLTNLTLVAILTEILTHPKEINNYRKYACLFHSRLKTLEIYGQHCFSTQLIQI